MLDKLIHLVLRRSEATAAAVIAKRKAIEAERARDTAREHAGREFVNSEGYTTPLPKAAQNAQNEYARARRDFEKSDAMGALSLAVTMMVARERRDETAAALKLYLAAEALRQTEGVHPEVKPFFADMFAMGIEPRRLPYVRVETLAIICDLIMWDGHDPEMEDPDSPMPAIFELYGSRLILKPGQFYDRSRSQPGVPVAKVKHTDPEYYLFDHLARAALQDSSVDGEDAAPVPDGMLPANSERDGDMQSSPGYVSEAYPPLGSWAELPREFSGFRLMDIDPEDNRLALPHFISPLPPSTDIAFYTVDRVAPQLGDNRRETYGTWIPVIEDWAQRANYALHHQQPPIWAMLLANRLSDDGSKVDFFNGRMIESPWQSGGIVEIAIVADDLPQHLR